MKSRSDKAKYLREWRKKNPKKCRAYYTKRDKEEIREKAWMRRYGITRKDYDTMYEKQQGSCAVCHTTEIGRGHTYFHVDHDHATGAVRGLLCDKCNRGLGYFDDDPTLLYQAGLYLEEELEDES